MARITVEDCLEQIPNRFSLVLVAAERAKQLLKGAEPLIADGRTNKEVVTALREVAAGMVRADLSQFDENEVARSSEHGPISHFPTDYGVPADADALPRDADDGLPPAADDDLPPEAD